MSIKPQFKLPRAAIRAAMVDSRITEIQVYHLDIWSEVDSLSGWRMRWQQFRYNGAIAVYRHNGIEWKLADCKSVIRRRDQLVKWVGLSAKGGQLAWSR